MYHNGQVANLHRTLIDQAKRGLITADEAQQVLSEFGLRVSRLSSPIGARAADVWRELSSSLPFASALAEFLSFLGGPTVNRADAWAPIRSESEQLHSSAWNPPFPPPGGDVLELEGDPRRPPMFQEGKGGTATAGDEEGNACYCCIKKNSLKLGKEPVPVAPPPTVADLKKLLPELKAEAKKDPTAMLLRFGGRPTYQLLPGRRQHAAHLLDVQVASEWIQGPGKTPCRLEWFEWSTSHDMRTGTPAKKWADVFASMVFQNMLREAKKKGTRKPLPPGFEEWWDDMKPGNECPKSTEYTFEDNPGAGGRPRKVYVRNFWIRFYCAEPCNKAKPHCKKPIELKLQQKLVWGNERDENNRFDSAKSFIKDKSYLKEVSGFDTPDKPKPFDPKKAYPDQVGTRPFKTALQEFKGAGFAVK